MTETMRALRLHGPNDLRLDEIEVPRPGPSEVLVQVHRCGICGTDLHIVRGDFPVPNAPLTLGHEFSGTVVEIGADERSLSEGDRVVVDINVSCGHCYFCNRGQKLFCRSVAQLGVHVAGALAEYVVAPATNVKVLPAALSLDAAAYVEPLACAIHGQDRLALRSGDTVLVLGAGPMGLAHVILSRLRGAARIIVSEPDADRRSLAARLGADVTIDPSGVDLSEAVADSTEGIGPDAVIEAVGSILTYEAAFNAVRRGGSVLAYGAAPADVALSLRPFDIYAKELTIVGSYAGTYDSWDRAIALLAGDRFDPDSIVNSVRPLDEALDAVVALGTDRSLIKVEIDIARSS